MKTLEKLQNISEELYNENLRVYKNQGGKILGMFCSYVPEELVIAAGMTPYRMRVAISNKTTPGDSWFTSFNCSYVRHLMDLILEGKFQFLDGIIFINACDHIRRLFDNWRESVDYPSFIHLVAVPRKKGGGALKWYYDELVILKKAMEDHFEIEITDSALRDATHISNSIRRSLGKIYEMRKLDSPPITGSETLSVIKAGTAIPRDQFKLLLDDLLEELIGRVVYKSGIPRIMLQSGCLEEIRHIKDIESQGCAVVTDSICFGRRYFDKQVENTMDDPLKAIADRYMNHLSCPRIADDWKGRLDNFEKAVKEYRVDGLICERLKFCDLWGGEAFILRENTKKSKFPILYFEREFHGRSEGQIKTRVQAFLERIKKKNQH